MRYDAMLAETVPLVGHGGDVIPAYLARPLGPGPFPGVVIAHHQPGWDDSMKEVTRTLASWGYVALCPNLTHRDRPDGTPQEQAEAAVAAGRVPDDRVVADLVAAVAALRALPTSSGRVGAVGFCAGGRHALLVATEVPVEAVVDCYGTRVAGRPQDLSDRQPLRVLDRLDRLRGPVLGLFGDTDEWVAAEEVAALEAGLDARGIRHRLVTYPGMGHAFMASDRPAYSVAEATAAWGEVRAFLAEALGTASGAAGRSGTEAGR